MAPMLSAFAELEDEDSRKIMISTPPLGNEPLRPTARGVEPNIVNSVQTQELR